MKRHLLPIIVLFLGLLLVIGGGHRLGAKAGEAAVAARRHAEASPPVPPKPAPLGQFPADERPRAPRSREEMKTFLEDLLDKGFTTQAEGRSLGMSFNIKAIDPLLADLTDEEFQLALELAGEIPTPLGQMGLRLALGRHWMKKDREAGWAYLQTYQPEFPPLREMWHGFSLAETVDIDPAFAARQLIEAVQKVKTAKTSEGNESGLDGSYLNAMWNILGKLSQTDLPLAFRTVEELPPENRHSAMQTVARGGLEAALDSLMEAMSQISDPALRLEWQQAAIGIWGGKDSTAAQQWLESLDLAPEPAARLARDLFGAWATREPRAALAWAQTRFPEPEHPALIEQMVQSWASREPNICGRWLGEQPTGPLTDPARAAFARTIVEKDPDSARAWAETISDPALREQCLSTLR